MPLRNALSSPRDLTDVEDVPNCLTSESSAASASVTPYYTNSRIRPQPIERTQDEKLVSIASRAATWCYQSAEQGDETHEDEKEISVHVNDAIAPEAQPLKLLPIQPLQFRPSEAYDMLESRSQLWMPMLFRSAGERDSSLIVVYKEECYSVTCTASHDTCTCSLHMVP
eukprot:1021171-Amphidinium_carterae.4